MKLMYAWEWGAGLGHLRRFKPLMDHILLQGHEVVAVTRDVEAARQVLDNPLVEIRQSPSLPSRDNDRLAEPRSLAGIAWNLGLGNHSTVSKALNEWRDLITTLRPTHCLADFGLLAAMASEACGIPAARIGTGFGLPPVSDPLASMTGQNVGSVELNLAEQVLENINSSRHTLGWGRVADWSAFLAVQGPVLLATLPEFDPYQFVRPQQAYYGNWYISGGLVPEWDPNPGTRTIAYLAHGNNFQQHCHSLLAVGLNMWIVGALNKSLESGTKGIRFSQQLLDLDRCARQCQLVICNANHGTTIHALALGLPVAVLPVFIEQRMNAQALERLVVGINLNSVPVNHWQAAIHSLVTDYHAQVRQKQYAERLNARLNGSLARVLAVLDSWLAS